MVRDSALNGMRWERKRQRRVPLTPSRRRRLWLRYAHSGPMGRNERHGGAGLKNHVGATPGLVVEQAPSMPSAGGVFREQDVARAKQKRLAVPRLKAERAAQRDDQLPRGCRMPIEDPAGRRLLE